MSVELWFLAFGLTGLSGPGSTATAIDINTDCTYNSPKIPPEGLLVHAKHGPVLSPKPALSEAYELLRDFMSVRRDILGQIWL